MHGKNEADFRIRRQSRHLHIIIDHEQFIFQIVAEEAVIFDTLEIARYHVIPEYLSENDSDSGFALAALTDEEHHLLTFGGRQKQISQVFLQGGHIFGREKLQKKSQELFGIICTAVPYFRLVPYIQTVDTEFLVRIKVSVQVELSVQQMYVTCIRQKRFAVTVVT